jgi:hypothetical protein
MTRNQALRQELRDTRLENISLRHVSLRGTGWSRKLYDPDANRDKG